MKSKILAIDVGTTNLKMGIFNESLTEEHFFEQNYGVSIFDGDKAEIDPEIWWQNIVKGCKSFGKYLSDVKVIAFSVTTPGLVAMDENGNALTQAILFLDQRSNKQAANIIDKIGKENLLEKACNLPVSGGSSLSSILWLKVNQPELFSRTCKFGHTNTFLVHKLTKKWAIDPSTTSITGLYNTLENNLTWNSGFLEKLSIPENKLPDLYHSYQEVGNVEGEIAQILGVSNKCKVLCGGNDAVLSAFSADIKNPGDVLHICGTCDIMMVCLDRPAGSADYNIRSHIIPGRWLTLFVLNTGGKSLDWFHSVFCSEMNIDNFFNGYVPKVIEDNLKNEIPAYLPFLQGSRYSTENLSAAFSKININTTRDDLLMALLKGNNMYMASHLYEISKVTRLNNEIILTGGGAKIRNMEKVKRKWIGEYRYKYLDQSSLHGAAKLGKMYLETIIS